MVAPLHSPPHPRQKKGFLTGCYRYQIKMALPTEEPNSVFSSVGFPLLAELGWGGLPPSTSHEFHDSLVLLFWGP